MRKVWYVSSNMNSKLPRFHSVRPNRHTVTGLAFKWLALKCNPTQNRLYRPDKIDFHILSFIIHDSMINGIDNKCTVDYPAKT